MEIDYSTVMSIFSRRFFLLRASYATELMCASITNIEGSTRRFGELGISASHAPRVVRKVAPFKSVQNTRYVCFFSDFWKS